MLNESPGRWLPNPVRYALAVVAMVMPLGDAVCRAGTHPQAAATRAIHGSPQRRRDIRPSRGARVSGGWARDHG
jgi:hypothetical protein